MAILAASALALAIGLSNAIPFPSFGFPELTSVWAPNDTALAVGYLQPGGTDVFVKEAEIFGVGVPAQQPNLGVRTQNYRSLAEYDGSYTIIMVDPDAPYPNDPTSRFYLHWLEANLTQTAYQNDDIGQPLANGSTPVPPVVPYASPAPPTDSSAHRYIIYAFFQPSNFTIPEQWSGLSGSNRSSFNLTNFIADTYLGTPAAAMFFYVSSQSAVPDTFVGQPGSQYPGGNGDRVTSGDPYQATAVSTSSMASTMSSTAGAAMITGAGALLGAGIVGWAAAM